MPSRPIRFLWGGAVIGLKWLVATAVLAGGLLALLPLVDNPDVSLLNMSGWTRVGLAASLLAVAYLVGLYRFWAKTEGDLIEERASHKVTRREYAELQSRVQSQSEATSALGVNVHGNTVVGSGNTLANIHPTQSVSAVAPPAHPLDGTRVFVDRDVYLPDVVKQADPDGVLRKFTFTRCTLRGPAVIVLLGRYVLSNSVFAVSSVDELFYGIGPGLHAGLVITEDCVFTHCRLENIGFAGTDVTRQQIANSGESVGPDPALGLSSDD